MVEALIWAHESATQDAPQPPWLAVGKENGSCHLASRAFQTVVSDGHGDETGEKNVEPRNGYATIAAL